MSISNLFSPNDDFLYANTMFVSTLDTNPSGELDIGTHATSIYIGNTIPNPVYINGILYPSGFSAYGCATNTSVAGDITIGANANVTFDQGFGTSPYSNMTPPGSGGFFFTIPTAGVYMINMYFIGQPVTNNVPLVFGVSVNGGSPTAENEIIGNLTTAGASIYECIGTCLMTLPAASQISFRNRTGSGSTAVTFSEFHYVGDTEHVANAKVTIIRIA